MRRLAFLALPVFFLVAMPLAAEAATATFFGPIVSPECTCPGTAQAPGYGCVLQTIQNLTNFGIALACIIVALVLAYSGFLFVQSAVNPETKSKAKSILLNAFIGLVIVLAAWLMVDFVMKTLYGGQFGPWNSILSGDAGSQCIVGKAPNSIFSGPGITATPGTGAGSAGTGAGVPSPAAGAIPGAICNAANSYRGASTSAGPDGGNKACAWAVNNVLVNAGLSSLGSNAVSSEEGALQGGRGTAITQSSASCGDIVIEGSTSHMGICLNNGCTEVLSNSSSKASFIWVSGPTFAPSYGTSNYRIYRVKN